MIKLVSSIALAGMMTLTIASAGQAQERTFRRMTAGPSAPLGKSMTQSQARRLCQMEMRGTRESRSAIRQKMAICMRKRMEGM
ncbi:hypothetical protein [Bosea psychrotolerans]|uniref:PsiF repeat-containing protein n=1 Tax=Bosea psychrotolerans TaxID=1871628 RepID=A0A2S4MFK5_9HYPH|nr:hypothetical protein [Bosea psychrotolerans]POR53415.1 hypothetical protein CYD53_104392 [Bosea psychrotolerans]